jgi:hypothetical protein
VGTNPFLDHVLAKAMDDRDAAANGKKAVNPDLISFFLRPFFES